MRANANQSYFLAWPYADCFNDLQATARILAVHARLKSAQRPEQCGHQSQHQGKTADHPKEFGAAKAGCHEVLFS
jgi:hypothetical protein